MFLGDVHSLLFLLLGVVIWFGVRFGTLTNALHTVVVGQLAVAATLAGTGPFAHESARSRTCCSSSCSCSPPPCMGLALSTGLDERTRLVAELRADARDEMTDQAQLLNAVVNSMAEGLAVVDDAGRWLLRNPAATRVGGLAGDLQRPVVVRFRQPATRWPWPSRAAPCATVSWWSPGPRVPAGSWPSPRRRCRATASPVGRARC